MPVDMAVDEPWTRIVCFEPNDSRFVLQVTNLDYVPTDGVFVVVYRRPSAAHDGKRVLERVFDKLTCLC